MDPSPQNENIQYQPSGFAPYNAKAAEPIMQPQQENYSQPVYGNEFPESMEKMDVDNVDVSINYMIRRGFIILMAFLFPNWQLHAFLFVYHLFLRLINLLKVKISFRVRFSFPF